MDKEDKMALGSIAVCLLVIGAVVVFANAVQPESYHVLGKSDVSVYTDHGIFLTDEFLDIDNTYSCNEIYKNTTLKDCIEV